MRKLVLRNFQAAGDILMLTAAVRDLHRACPGAFATDVRTPFPDLWENNPCDSGGCWKSRTLPLGDGDEKDASSSSTSSRSLRAGERDDAGDGAPRGLLV